MNPDTQLALDEAAAAPVVAHDLTTVEGILAEMARQGCTFRVAADGRLFRTAEGKTKFVGNPTGELWAALMDRRAETLAAYEAASLARYEEEHNRWCRAPHDEVALYSKSARLNDRERKLIEDYACNQLNRTLAEHIYALANWLQAREQIYAQAGEPPRDAGIRASLDLVCWQRRLTNPREALAWLEGLEEAETQSEKLKR